MSPVNTSLATSLYKFSNATDKSVTNETHCFHCGLNCLNSVYQEAGHLFCCAGCLTVYQFLNSQGLSNFYRLGAAPGNTAQEKKSEPYQFEYLDDKELFEKIIDYRLGDIAVITLKLPGIHCASCIWLLENLHQIEKNVKKVQVNFLKKQARIHFDSNGLALSGLVRLLEKIGYLPEFSWKNFNKSKQLNNRKELIKIGIAGFAFGNVMMLSFPDYFSNEVPVDFKKFLGYACLILSLPVLLFAARDWFLGAWKAIKHKHITLDIPIVIGLLILFTKSTFDVLVEQEVGYFDSLCAFVFFMLLARYFQKITFEKLSFTDGILSYFPMAVTIIKDGIKRTVPFTKIQVGDELFLRNGEVIPVESTMISESGLVDYSYLTGESELVTVGTNDKLLAGGKINGQGVSVIASKPIEGQILEQIWQDSERSDVKNRKTFADRISPYFVGTIVTIASLAFLIHLLLGRGYGFGIYCFASVLIITCPCALAISAPLVYGVMQRKLAKRGFYLRSGEILEGLAEADTIVFDKTGTLTYSEKELYPVKENLTEDEKAACGALASNSIHPISKQISKWSHQNFISTSFEEKVGKGIQGFCNSLYIQIGSVRWFEQLGYDLEILTEHKNQAENLLLVSIDNKIMAIYKLQDKFRENGKEILVSLQNKYDLHVISGDHDKSRENLEQIGLNRNQIHFQYSPLDKQEYIQALVKQGKKVIMIGDGLNDQEALRSSHVGIAISEESSHFSPASDVILIGKQWSELPYFIASSKQAVKLIKLNLGFSLLYNIFGIYIAVGGMLTPIYAAILMPVSSLTVVLVAAFGSSIVLSKRQS